MDRRKLLARLARGAVKNVAFADLQNLAEGFGFELRRVSGSHHIYAHAEVEELLNLQVVHGQAKPYQVRQMLRLIERYGLSLMDDT
ncbi:MAG: type II toxin-antitoxin system HicA family toxin [Gemmatimonadales bacterium]